jgi:isopenicillin N synthase-like dioxygenase
MKEAFNIGLDLAPDDLELMAGKPFRSLNAWPELSGFRKTALAYYNACAALGARLHRAFARDLGLQPDFFTDKFDRPMAIVALSGVKGCGRIHRRGRAYRLWQSHAARD